MAWHARTGKVQGVRKQRLVIAGCTLASVCSFVAAYVERANRDSVLNFGGWGVLIGAVTVVVASLSIGPRPLRSFGAGAWFCAAAGGAFLAFAGRHAPEVTNYYRGEMQGPLMLIIGPIMLAVGLWLMIWRPEQNWERELREASERTDA